MNLTNYTNIIKQKKGMDNLHCLVYSILKLEETLIEAANNIEKTTIDLQEVLFCSFLFIKENKIEITNEKIKDLDLNYWKDNINIFKSVNPNMSVDVYLYSIRNSVLYLQTYKKDKILSKAYIFEVIIKTFLLIDFLNLSIDSLLKLNLSQLS